MSRKLDVAIAKALGYEVRSEHLQVRGIMHYLELPDGKMKRVPCYSGIGDSMLRLDREMRRRGWLLEFWWGTPKTCWAGYKKHDNDQEYQATTITIPLAVALAAYKALTGKDWEEGDQP